MMGGLSDYWATHLRDDPLYMDAQSSAPIVPRRVTEHGRMMWAEDLGLGENAKEHALHVDIAARIRKEAETGTGLYSGLGCAPQILSRNECWWLATIIEETDGLADWMGEKFGKLIRKNIELRQQLSSGTPAYFWLGKDAEAT